MGLRSLERKLAPEICYRVVARVVDDYLRGSTEAGHLLDPFEHLKMPILRKDLNPPGLHDAVQEVARLRPRSRKRFRAGKIIQLEPASSDDLADEPLELPEADELIRKIFLPFAVEGLRSHHQRLARADALRRGGDS